MYTIFGLHSCILGWLERMDGIEEKPWGRVDRYLWIIAQMKSEKEVRELYE